MAECFSAGNIYSGWRPLGKTEAEVRIDVWDSLDETSIASARTCAQGVIAAIRKGIFWPPSEQLPDWDEHRDSLSPTAAEAVDPEGLGIRPNPL